MGLWYDGKKSESKSIIQTASGTYKTIREKKEHLVLLKDQLAVNTYLTLLQNQAQLKI